MHIARWSKFDKPLGIALFAAALLAPTLLAAQPMSGSDTLARVRSTGRITFGYFAAAKPLSFRDASGNADGYSVALCRGIADAVKQELKLPNLEVQFVPVGADPIGAVKEGRIDLLCAPMQPTLSRRQSVSFSIPVFASGTSVLIRNDAPADFHNLLEGRELKSPTLWRGAPILAVLAKRNFAVVSGTASQQWLTQRKRELNVNSEITPVPSVQAGLQRLVRGESDAFVADRSVLADLVQNDPVAKGMKVINRSFDTTWTALALRRGDEDFRLLVDRALSELYSTGKIDGIYAKYLGKASTATREWFRNVAEPN